MNVYGGLASNVYHLDFWKCLDKCDVELFCDAFEKDREAWTVFCNGFVCREIENEYSLECRRVSNAFCAGVMERVPSLALEVSKHKEFVKRIVGVENLDTDCLRICEILTRVCGEGWCLDRMYSLAVSLWYVFCFVYDRTPSVDVFETEDVVDVGPRVVELVSALPASMSASLLSSKIGIRRLDSIFTRVLESSGKDRVGVDKEMFVFMNSLYGNSASGSSSAAYTQWALRYFWLNHLSEGSNGCLDDIGVTVIMIQAITKLQFDDPTKFNQASLDANTWCLDYLKKPSVEVDNLSFLSNVCEMWLNPTRLAGIHGEDVATSTLVYHIAAITCISASRDIVTMINPWLVYSFPLLVKNYIPLVFGLITRTNLECITSHSGKYCCINGILLNPSKDDSRPLTGRKSQWDMASSRMWESAFSICLNDALDLILALTVTSKVDRYLIQHCNTPLLELLVSSSDTVIVNRCLGIVSQPVFANVLFTSGKRRLACKQGILDTVEGCIRDGRSKRWAIQLLSVGVDKKDWDFVEVVGRIRDLLVERDGEDNVGKVYANKCLAGDEAVAQRPILL
jgi:hypothetical protein